MLNELAGLQLVKRKLDSEHPYLEVDKSLQLAILLKLSRDSSERQAAFGRVVNILREFFLRPNHLQQAGISSWTITLKIIPHLLQLLAVHNWTQFRVQPFLPFVELLVDVSHSHMVHHGFVAEAKAFLKSAEETLYVIKIPMGDAIYTDIFTLMGLCSDMSGISSRAQGHKTRQKYLQICERGLAAIPAEQRTTHHEVKLVRAKMSEACSHQHFNNFQQVAKVCNEYYLKKQDWKPEFCRAHDYAEYLNHMAYVYLYNGEFEKAIAKAKQGYDLIVKESSDVLIAARHQFSWATIMFQSGQYNTAIKEHEQILDLRIQHCGECRFPTLQSLLNIGIMHYLIREHSVAEFVSPKPLTGVLAVKC